MLHSFHILETVAICPVSQIHNCCSVAEASSHGLLIQLDDHGSQVAMEDNLVSAARKLGVIAGYETCRCHCTHP